MFNKIFAYNEIYYLWELANSNAGLVIIPHCIESCLFCQDTFFVVRPRFEYIDSFIYDGLKEYYYPDDEITIRVVAAKGYEMSLFINEEKIEGGILNESEGYTEYKFIMPDEDVFCEVKDEQIAE